MTEIALKSGDVILVDEDCVPLIKRYSWRVVTNDGIHRYVSRSGRRNTAKLLHRVILDAPRNMKVDHINGNGLDNRRENLRLATDQLNAANQKVHRDSSTGFKGVMVIKGRGVFRAKMRFGENYIHIGVFDDPVKAAHAYDEVARKKFGDFARVNFPQPGEQGCRS